MKDFRKLFDKKSSEFFMPLPEYYEGSSQEIYTIIKEHFKTTLTIFFDYEASYNPFGIPEGLGAPEISEQSKIILEKLVWNKDKTGYTCVIIGILNKVGIKWVGIGGGDPLLSAPIAYFTTRADLKKIKEHYNKTTNLLPAQEDTMKKKVDVIVHELSGLDDWINEQLSKEPDSVIDLGATVRGEPTHLKVYRTDIGTIVSIVGEYQNTEPYLIKGRPSLEAIHTEYAESSCC